MNASRCSECGAVASSGAPAEYPVNFDAAPGTRHHRLLNSNEVPLDSDSINIKSVISTARVRLAVVEDELSRLRERMESLEKEHAALSSHLAQNNSILSPLRRMPPEVLGEIFSWTLPSVGVLREGHLGVAVSPWVLTHISSRWRTVSLSSPSLWSLVVVDFSHESPYPLPMVKAHIQRAHLLKIHFYGDEESDSRPQIEMLQHLVEHSSRWHELGIGLTSKLVPLLAGLRDRIPVLHRLSIEWDVPESQAGVQSIDCFESAPSLFDAAIFNEYRHIPTLVPAHPLTHYDIDGPWAMHRGILALAPNLVQARIYISFDDEPSPDSGEIIHLLHLQRLFVSDAVILNHLKAPVLQEIAFKGEEAEATAYLSHLDPFILRSGCTLRRLSFDGTPTTCSAVDILRKYPSITELAILIVNFGDPERASDLISHLTIPDSTESVMMFPQLSEISFGCYNDDSCIDYPLFLHMLQSRWNAKGYALRTVSLLINSDTAPDAVTLRALDVLRREGMDLLVLQGLEASNLIDSWLHVPNWT